jgi:hypothetical protein
MNIKKSRHKKSGKSTKQTRASRPTKADKADRHVLYEQSVQSTEFEFEFVDKNFRRIRGRKAKLLREDFCGTAQMCCEWVRRRGSNHAIGVDLDADVLQWSREHHIEALKPEEKARVTLLQENVLTVKTDPVDAVLAMNFSWQIFKQRSMLRDYFAAVRDSLADDGIFFLDSFGGYDAYREIEEKTRHKGFTYVWDQDDYDPLTGDMRCHIHFHFNDGSKLKKAFTYEWRLYGLPEVRDILLDAGFSNVTIYWQGWDKDGEPDGDFRPATRGEADPGWIAMLSAEK